MVSRIPIALGLVALLFVVGSAGASSRAGGAGATASAIAVRVVVPGVGGATVGAVSAPPDASSFGGGPVYPADGSVVSIGSLTSTATASTDASATSSASAEVTGLSVFGGEITADAVAARSSATATADRASGDTSQSSVSNLQVLGAAVTAGAGTRVSLGDWGYAVTLAGASDASAPTGSKAHRGFVTALEITLTAEHNGLPIGTQIQVGFAESWAQSSLPAKPEPKPKPAPKPKPKQPDAGPKPSERQADEGRDPGRDTPLPPPVIKQPPPDLDAKLTPGGYVFPVYGPSSFTNTFQAPRAGVGWHHGVDIFAPLGAPILAVADGTLFSVGWNDLGGNRLWLRDRGGNEFYYAHLSAFSTLAVDGARVNAGDVIGFNGNTGDAENTPYHLHFEIHPVSLLFLGYDGVVDPTPYVAAWKRLQDVRFRAAAGWAPAVRNGFAPPPGAMLLQATDISTANGLDPGSLRRALAPPSSESDGALLRRFDDALPDPSARGSDPAAGEGGSGG